MSEHLVVLGAVHGQHPEVRQFAVREAARRTAMLRVVHVWDDAAVSMSVFDDVKEIVAAQGAGVEVTYAPVPGDVTDVLLDEARRASVLVLGADDAPWVAQAAGASISQVVAMHAVSPVIVVPRTSPGTQRRTSVVVALDLSGGVDGQLAFAFDAAARLHDPLHVIHVAGIASDYPTRVNRGYQLEETVDRWRAHFPQVRVRIEVEPGHPVRTCATASAHASLLVVGQPIGDNPRLASRAVMSRLLRRSSSPVAVVPVEFDRVGQQA